MAGPVGVDKLPGFAQELVRVSTEVVPLGLDEVSRKLLQPVCGGGGGGQ